MIYVGLFVGLGGFYDVLFQNLFVKYIFDIRDSYVGWGDKD